jgi:hypothetical protein
LGLVGIFLSFSAQAVVVATAAQQQYLYVGGPAKTVSVTGKTANTALTATTQNSAVVTATATATLRATSGTVKLTAVAPGTTTVVVSGGGSQATITANVFTPFTLTPTAPAVPIGSTTTIAIAGGSGSFTAVSATPANVQVQSINGTSMVLKGSVAGTSRITVTDTRTLQAVVITATAKKLLSSTTTTLNMVVGKSATITLANANGTVTASTSGAVTITSNTNTQVVVAAAGTPGTGSVTITDGLTTLVIPVNVYSAVTLSPSTLSVPINWRSGLMIVGGSGSYSVANANAALLMVTPSGLTSGSPVGTSLDLLAGATPSATAVKVTVTDTVTNASASANVKVVAAPLDTGYRVLGWNDLGMHCMDADYSVFSILPPFNTFHAQLMYNGKLVTSTTGVSVTYESFADPTTGNINTTSSGKTNFWDFSDSLLGFNGAVDTGLYGFKTPSTSPANMSFVVNDPGNPPNPNYVPPHPNYVNKMFEAIGTPITPYDDKPLGSGTFPKNTYPMVKVVARDSFGNPLASAKVVLPVSDEMDCRSCHSSVAPLNDARPSSGWVTAALSSGDQVQQLYRLNILKLHDEKSQASASSSLFNQALTDFGYSGGLEASARSGKPVLCASCHASNALGTGGGTGILPLTTAMHKRHANVKDQSTAPFTATLGASNNRAACYQCHPGSTTACLRGAMGSSVTQPMQCQNCHGNMANVGKVDSSGNPARTGWFDQPNCQACHHDGGRLTSAVDVYGDPVKHTAIADTTFATNPDVPATGISLYRFSMGHGNLQCEACHGSTHAEYPSSHPNDNIMSTEAQGYAGTIRECTACHVKDVASNATNMFAGPHGMHPIGQSWVTNHHDIAKGNQYGVNGCQYCHDARNANGSFKNQFQGSPLSAVKDTRTKTFTGKGTHTYVPGQEVGCYDCHNGPTGG